MIGVAGCGRMGLPMARALDAAGLGVRGFDVVPIDAPFMAPDVAAFADGLTTLITVVRDQEETDAVLFGARGLIHRAPTIERIVICSTLSPRYVRDLRARVPEHISLIDAPMSGAQVAAEEARLTFMVGASDAELAALRPIFDAMGTRIHHMGPFGMGMQAKVLNNLVAASSVMATRTALAWGAAQGLEETRLRALMHDSTGQTWFGSQFERIEFARDGFASDNTIGILKKDVEAALDAAPDGADTTLADALIAGIAKLDPFER
ncbi:MAG: NAD(P)-binding domain-containing protein [Pseudomonadota bacterium]